MNQREKLIELLNETFAQQYEKRGVLTADHTADFLLFNGVIVPPCKVGDVLYTTYDSDTEVERLNVNEILIKTCDGYVFFVINYRYYFSFDSFGKTVFLTREEAEKALAERSGE